MRLEHPDEPHLVALGGLEVLLDPEGRVDEHRLADRLVADEVGRAAVVLVDELPEDHVCDRSTRPR